MDMSITIPLVIVGILSFGLLIAALVSISHVPDAPKEGEEQARNIGLYDWNGQPTEGQHYVLVDLSDDGRNAL